MVSIAHSASCSSCSEPRGRHLTPIHSPPQEHHSQTSQVPIFNAWHFHLAVPYPPSEVESSFPGRKFEELMKLTPKNKHISSMALASDWASQVTQMVKNLPAMHTIQVEP